MPKSNYTLLIIFLFLLIGQIPLSSSLNEGTNTSRRHKSSINQFGTPIIADHSIIRQIMDDEVPESMIENAKNNLHIAYQHTSHGSQITTGMLDLPAFKEGLGGTPGLYDWNDGPLSGALDLDDYAMGSYAPSASDLGYDDWALATRNYLNDPAHSDVNVVMWSWCGQVGSYTEQGLIDHYLDPMTQLENDFPNVHFVYMTGHTDGAGLAGSVAINNQQIRDYCLANNKILFDFEDIESFNPDGEYFGDRYVDDACNYQIGNWAIEWQDAHPGEWYSCSSAHSQPLNANMKAYAAWWLWVRLAGWNGRNIIAPSELVNGTVISGNIVLNFTLNNVTFDSLQVKINDEEWSEATGNLFNPTHAIFEINTTIFEDGIHKFQFFFNNQTSAEVLTFSLKIINHPENNSPFIVSPGNCMTSFTNKANVNITWTISDEHSGGSYFVYLGYNPVVSDRWWNGSISFNLASLSIGNNRITLVALDIIGNQATDTVWITVFDDTVPPSIGHPSDIKWDEESSKVNITWTRDNCYPLNYTIYQNGTIKASGSWNTTELTISIDDLSPGVYNFTIIICYETGLSSRDRIIVTIVDKDSKNSGSNFDTILLISAFSMVILTRKVRTQLI